jgi:hypothetical protein
MKQLVKGTHSLSSTSTEGGIYKDTGRNRASKGHSPTVERRASRQVRAQQQTE